MTKPGNYFVGAPTHQQVKRIYWQDLKLLSFAPLLPEPPLDGELIIRFPNGSQIFLIGLDKPERFEGIAWTGGVIDEIANVKEAAWALNIRPALDTWTPDTVELPWCWLIGVPDGLNHYYEMYQYALTGNDPDWAAYHWKSAEILPQKIIDSARRELGPMQFRQEYEASFETATGRVYNDYGPANHCGETIQPHEQLLWMHDFNFSPMSSALGVRRNGDSLLLLDEIVLHSATSRQSALEFVDRYKAHKNRKIIIYGDPAGKAGEKHGIQSNYTEMEDVLRAHNWQVERRVRSAAPAIRDRQNAVRAKIASAAGDISLWVNPAKAKMVDKGLRQTVLKEGSSFIEDDADWQHITTAIGYCVEREWPIKRPIVVDKMPNMPTVNHWSAA